MYRFLILFILCAFVLTVKAQTQPGYSAVKVQSAPNSFKESQPYGKVDMDDLEMKFCDFEMDANAEVLFDKGSVSFNQTHEIVFERHIRIKIFNDKAKNEANIKIRYLGRQYYEHMTDVEAETINLDNGAIKFTKIDKKLIYMQKVDRIRSDLVFSFPDIRPGSVIEFKYTLTARSITDFPNWYFQTNIPTRYSEISTKIPDGLYYKNLEMINQPYVINTAHVKALANIPSLSDEPYMSSRKDNLQRIEFINPPTQLNSWDRIGAFSEKATDFGEQFERKIAGEADIISKAKGLGSDADKVSFIFIEVKDAMKWNKEDVVYTNEGTAEAWDKKTGNSTEINLILYHLLQKSGLKVFPMLVSTKANGKINPAYPNDYQFNRTVAYIPVDSTFNYVLDATSKYNIYNETPRNLLNGFGFYIDKDNEKYQLVFLQKTAPVREVTLINAEISPDGKMTGTVQINSFSYNRIDYAKKYKTDGEEKYIKALVNGDNSLKIGSLKFDNMEVDTLPLTQNIEFKLDLTGSDENYIYFKPNLFTQDYANEFLSENRFTDIDFGYQSNDALNGIYKIPAGYKIDAMPKSITMGMTDKSIVFKRMVAEQEGSVMVRYVLYFKKSLYFKEDYPEIHAFFKKMNEMMDEQVVLKKS